MSFLAAEILTGNGSVANRLSPRDFVILWRSKERSDAAQTIESMPRLQGVATVQNSAPLHPSREVAAWILGSARPLRPWMTKFSAKSA